MAFDFSTLITDRSPEDLQALRDLLSTPMSEWTTEQLAEFNQAVSKGAYNYTDLNRVTACMDYLNERLTALGYVTGYQRIEIPHKGGGGLPEGYTKLEYIESTGTQYIDTGFAPNQDTRLVMDVQATSVSANAWLFDGRQSSSVSSKGVLWHTGYSKWCADYNGSASRYRFTTLGNTERLYIDYNKNTININGEEHTFTADTFQSPASYTLLACNTNGSVSGRVNARLYSCQIYDNGSLIRDFIPASDSSGTVGLYDLVNNTFYSNAGTGDFISGAEIPAEPGEVLDPYTWYEEDTPTQSKMVQYISNINALRSVLPLATATPNTPLDMKGLTFEEANAIEQILNEIEIVINSMSKIFLRSGTSWVISGAPNLRFAN